MAASFRVLPRELNVASFNSCGQTFGQKLLSFCLKARALHSCSSGHRSWLVRRSLVRGVTDSRKVSSKSASRVISPVMAELLKSIQYGKEQWMEQSRRNTLAKKFDEGIIDLHSTEYDKLTLEHFQVFWPDGKPIWTNYRRNFKGQFPPQRTRRNCFRGTNICSNPCPICRLIAEKNYELVYTDVGLLSQFICPHTGMVLETAKTGVCQKQQKLLIKAIQEAQDKGLLPFTIPGPRDPPRVFQPVGVPSMFKNRK
ncbi:hypothetical protein ACROYT_G004051 [Oculina patagonica]